MTIHNDQPEARGSEDTELTDDQLFTEEGYPSGELVEEVYKHMFQKFGDLPLKAVGPNIFEVFDQEQKESGGIA